MPKNKWKLLSISVSCVSAFSHYNHGIHHLIKWKEYVKQKYLAAGRISWDGLCCAKLKTFNNVLEGRTNEHTCTELPNHVHGEILRARNAMTIQADISDDTSNNIIGANVQQFSEEARVQLLRMETVRRGIWHA